MLRADAPCATARTEMPAAPMELRNLPATFGCAPICSPTSVTSVTGEITGSMRRSPDWISGASASAMLCFAWASSTPGITTENDWPSVDSVVSHTRTPASPSAARMRPPSGLPSPVRRDCTPMSARRSRLVTQVGRFGSGLPLASMRVPGASGWVVLRMTSAAPHSRSGMIVRGWNIRVPKYASSSASS